jgi:molybdate/tungstate transport system substrate-binding protein
VGLKKCSLLQLFLILIPFIFILFYCTQSVKSKENTLYVLHAGSLSLPFKELAEAFTLKHPGVNILLEGHGSRTCARQISELGKRIDVFASADSAVITNLLIPKHADFVTDFATNEIVIAYHEQSRYAKEINQTNWFEIALKEDVEFGYSNPDMDPCGYRSILTMKLAEKYYSKEGLYRELADKIPLKNIKPKETDLLAMLESVELDYIFIYRSIARQHGLNYLKLPPEINLSSEKMKKFYQSVRVKITGRRPGEYIVKRGMPMVYGITIPKAARNKNLAVKFLNFVLSREGREIMSKNGQGIVGTIQTVDLSWGESLVN